MVVLMTQSTGVMRALAAAVFVVALMTACGGGDDSSSGDAGPSGDAGQEVASLGTEPEAPTGSDVTDSSAPIDPEEAQLAFAQCMREHGIDVPDPGTGGGLQITGGAENQDEMDAAMEACEPLLENARDAIEQDPEREAEMREQMLEFTECMRDHGIDMPDPQFDEDGGFSVQAQAGEQGGDPRTDDEFEAAAEECGGPGQSTVSTDPSADG
jgi:hypothetical protein